MPVIAKLHQFGFELVKLASVPVTVLDQMIKTFI